jgi:hypothetical protein
MRTVWTIAMLLALSPMALSSASAKDVANKQYGTCLCHFGYGNVCQASIACDNEGGRCGGTCSMPPNATLTNR